MIQEIVRILGQSSAGVTLQEIVRAVKGGDPIAIQQFLESLQKKKLVRIDKAAGRWRLIGARAPADNTPGAGAKSRRARATSSLRGIEAVGLVASRFRIKPRPISQISETKFDSRALLRYYRDCLAAEERSDSSASMDEAGERFLPVQLEGTWWPTTTELPRFTIATQLLPPTFQQAMGRAKSDAVLHLGYPLEVFAASDDGLMVRAIASVPLRWKAIGDGLVELSPIDTSLSVNPNWISYHLKNFDFFALLRRLGADNSDEDTEALTTELGELPDLCAALNLAFAQKRLDDLDPTKTASTLLRDFGIQNAAALFVVADARFSAGAIRDLTELSKREIAEFKGTALGTVLGLEIPRMTNNPSVVEPLDLTFSQLTAVRSGLSECSATASIPLGGLGRAECKRCHSTVSLNACRPINGI